MDNKSTPTNVAVAVPKTAIANFDTIDKRVGERRVIPVDVFDQNFLESFAVEDMAAPNKASCIMLWREVAGNINTEVDVVDSNRNVILTVPSLDVDIELPKKVDGTDTRQALINNYDAMQVSPERGAMYLKHTMKTIIAEMKPKKDTKRELRMGIIRDRWKEHKKNTPISGKILEQTTVCDDDLDI